MKRVRDIKVSQCSLCHSVHKLPVVSMNTEENKCYTPLGYEYVDRPLKKSYFVTNVTCANYFKRNEDHGNQN